MRTQFIMLALASLAFFSETRKEEDYTPYVNPLIGTDFQKNPKGDKAPSEHKGQTMPAVGVPNGMTNWVPQTIAGEKKCNSPYYYYQDAIQGFRASHWLNGSCTQDYGSVTVMPVSGQLKTDAEKRASKFSHEKELSTPYQYTVSLDSYPMWNNYTAAMIGDHGLSLIGDAIMKDISGFDYEEAYRLMRKTLSYVLYHA